MNAPTAATRVFALLGDPVGHSLSPRIHNAAIAALGLDAVFVALRCGAAELPGLLRGIAAAGGGGSVTVPHKGDAARVVDHATRAVERTGACNTFWLEDGRIRGDNTDVDGFAAAVGELIGAPTGARVLLLGAGGAARAALYALLRDGAEQVVVRNRDPARGAALCRALEPAGRRARALAAAPAAGPAGAVAGARERFDLVVNATTLGLRADDPLPWEPHAEALPGAVLDLVYREGDTPWVRRARELGVPALDGKAMLVAQAAEAFERWWDRPAPLEAMRTAVGL
jgi:shikimate dehydrogenase